MCDSAIKKTEGKLSTWFSHAKKKMLVITIPSLRNMYNDLLVSLCGKLIFGN